MNDSVLAQLAALPEKSTSELNQLDLYDREPPPPYNKPFLIRQCRVHRNPVQLTGSRN